ncbi:MAG: DNA repair protein RecN, partial [bacterium]
SDRRRRAAPLLEQVVAAQLADLGMIEANVPVVVESRDGWEGLRETGADSVEFLLAANPGQLPRSLSRTASGGELSRVLLAIKCALAGAGGNETLIFDEIDAGIGGRTAVAVGRKLRELAARSQLIVVTHLAHVAALASRHYLIDKTSGSGVTVTRLSLLSGEDVVQELCRMMGGRPDDTEAMAHARELRDRAVDGLLD